MKIVYNHVRFKDTHVIYARHSPMIPATTTELLEHVSGNISYNVFALVGDRGVRGNIGGGMSDQ